MSLAVYKVSFTGAGADSGLHIAAIADFERNKNADGTEKTTFYPGEPFHFLIQHDPRLYIADIRCSHGGISGGSNVTRTHRDNEVQFEDSTATVELAYTPASMPATRWYGNAPATRLAGRVLTPLGGPLPAIGRASYDSRWKAWTLTPGPMSIAEGEDWPILIVCRLEMLP